jgi:H+-transporting ATPase
VYLREALIPGDLVMLGAGGAIPADCVLHDGHLEVDEAALTGESLPVTMTARQGLTLIHLLHGST